MALLAQPNPAVMRWCGRTDSPSRSPLRIWLRTTGFWNMDSGRKRNDYMRHNPRVSLTALKDGA